MREIIRKCVNVLNAPGGTVNAKVCFLTSKGVDMVDIMEALNVAGDGALLEAAGLPAPVVRSVTRRTRTDGDRPRRRRRPRRRKFRL